MISKVFTLYIVMLLAQVAFAKAPDISLRERAEREILIKGKKNKEQRLATVNAPLPELAKRTSASGSFSLLFTSQRLEGRSRYVDPDQVDLGQISSSPAVSLLLEREFSFLPVSTWFGVHYSGQTSNRESPLLEADPMSINTLAFDLGPGYRLRLFATSFLNIRASFGRFWLMQNSETGLANESRSISYASAQLNWEVSSLWGSPWRPIVALQKRWNLSTESARVADPLVYLGIMYRGDD